MGLINEGMVGQPVIFADFNNFDRDGCIRLNCAGTVRDLQVLQVSLFAGLRLPVSDGDLRAFIEVVAPSDEGIWRGRIITVIAEREPATGVWSPL